MDAALNPFSPGAGSPPPELSGRQAIIDDATVALRRAKMGRSTRSQFLLGLRGVGKTVLLNRIGDISEIEGFVRLQIETPENERLASLLVPALRRQLLALSAGQKARALARRALGMLRTFASIFKVSVGDIEISVEDASPGFADSGKLEIDLPDLLIEAVLACKAADRGLALFIDEVQYLNQEDLAALIVSVHKISQKTLPFLVFGAGLPQLAALAGEAKSYAERLFTFAEAGPIDDEAARGAIEIPLQSNGVEIDPEALAMIVRTTRGYPYFLQEWGAYSWNIARRSPITTEDVGLATERAIKDLDASFFRVRFDRLTPRERIYLRAMAELGPGPQRSGSIARLLRIRVENAGALREGLIRKGMIYSPQHGETAFTVPMFDEFLKRTMPAWRPIPVKPHRKKPTY